jgi:malonyl-CoA O-methyltransferase
MKNQRTLIQVMRSKTLGKIRKFLSRWISHLDRAQSLPVIPPQKGYELWAASYGENMNPVQELESKALKELLPPLRGCVVLDLGCGKGRVSRLALERGAEKTIGLDFSWQMLQAASAETCSASAYWLTGSAVDLPFKRETFDVVICALLMGHLQNPDAVLSKIYKVLRPGGFLLLSDFHPYETLRGSVRSFRDVESNRSFAIKQHAHQFEYYLKTFNKLGFTLEDLREPHYGDFPLVFVLSARKQLERI